MWLIDTTTIRLKFVPGPGSSPYVVLSHTWNGDNEVSFQEFNSPVRDIDGPRFQKIVETCRKAREKRIPYAWVDTCCIDKTSSAELSEAINSMFHWYKKSAVCFTYLADLAEGSGTTSLPKCHWFTRGWTLQELVAPKKVEFYDEGWNYIGQKANLLQTLAEITLISQKVLNDSDLLPDISVAARMSWAAKRSTTREEDLAYCLLGIFDVYIPLIYGERSNAFMRLQEAIANATNDLSLFAWNDQDKSERRQKYHGIFARSPMDFTNCHTICRFPAGNSMPGYTLNNKGLRLIANLYDRKTLEQEKDSLLSLQCYDEESRDLVVIRLVQTPTGWVRHCAHLATFFSGKSFPELYQIQRCEMSIFKLVTSKMSESLTKDLLQGIQIALHNSSNDLVRMYPEFLWNTRREVFMVDPRKNFASILELSISPTSHTTVEDGGELLRWFKILILYVGIDMDGEVGHWVGQISSRIRDDILQSSLDSEFNLLGAVTLLTNDYGLMLMKGDATEMPVVPSMVLVSGQTSCLNVKEEGMDIAVTISDNSCVDGISKTCQLAINVTVQNERDDTNRSTRRRPLFAPPSPGHIVRLGMDKMFFGLERLEFGKSS